MAYIDNIDAKKHLHILILIGPIPIF